MAMGVYGIKPKNDVGICFRDNIWGWHPLAYFITQLCPEELTAKCQDWHSNSGFGLNAEDSVALSDCLDELLRNGSAAEYVKERDTYLAGLPDETCGLCQGTGILTESALLRDKLITDPKHPRYGQKGWCTGCDGRGKHRPRATWFQLDVEDIAKFSAFLRCCGGFRIC